jgi:hypothetical protein
MSMAERLEEIALSRQHAHISAMHKRATKRPGHFVKPAHWTSEPAPAPAPSGPDEANEPDGLSPTRYGDWVHKGLAVDF